LLLAILLPLLHCNAQKNLWQLGLPGVNTPFVVVEVTERGGFLDATLRGGGFSLVSYTPANEVCVQVLRKEARVEWLSEGQTGAFRRDGETCHAAGIGSLQEWRNRGPRPQTLRSDPVPRAQANYRLVHQDEEFALLRGSFPLASMIRWVGGNDSIAVVPNTENCQGAIGRTTSSMQFYPSGRNVLVLVGSRGLCPIVGLIRPPPSAAAAPAHGGGVVELPGDAG
jgi:hypothetical protein